MPVADVVERIEEFDLSPINSDQGFAGSKTGAFEKRNLFIILVGHCNEIKPCTSSIMQFFGFRSEHIPGFC